MNVTQLRKDIVSVQNTETNILVKYVDEETGEIDPEAFKKLEKLGIKKEEIISSAMESFHSFNELAQLVNEKLARIKKLEKIYKTTADSIKKILAKYTPEGENIYSKDYMISWRPSTIVDIDGFINMEDYPQFLRIEKNWNKTAIKTYVKKQALPEGIKIIKKQNIQLK